MKKLRQFDTLVIEDLVKEEFHQPSHGQNYYEIVFIFSGEGVHHINGNRLNYEANDLFLISPEDIHYLEIRSLTHFGAIKFTDGYFVDKQQFVIGPQLRTRPDVMMKSRAFKEQRLLTDEFHSLQLRSTVQRLMEWKDSNVLEKSPFVFFQILSIFGMIHELWGNTKTIYSPGQSAETLISYVHQHIYEPDKIQIRNIAETFHISPNYFSTYFRSNFGISYRQYVDNYRLKLIENRIKTGLTLKQIAIEFDFTDESHLSNFFKKHRNISFSEFRFRHRNESGG